MIKEVIKAGLKYKKAGAFLGGLAFGTAGLKLLSSKEAKKGYAKVISKSYKVKDSVEATVSSIKQQTDDVLADAKDMYEAEKAENDLCAFEDKTENITK